MKKKTKKHFTIIPGVRAHAGTSQLGVKSFAGRMSWGNKWTEALTVFRLTAQCWLDNCFSVVGQSGNRTLTADSGWSARIKRLQFFFWLCVTWWSRSRLTERQKNQADPMTSQFRVMYFGRCITANQEMVFWLVVLNLTMLTLAGRHFCNYFGVNNEPQVKKCSNFFPPALHLISAVRCQVEDPSMSVKHDMHSWKLWPEILDYLKGQI